VRLISLLHACALETVSNIEHKEFPILDPAGIEEEPLEFLKRVKGRCRVDVVFQWINSLLVDAMLSGMIDVPAPIYTRIFQQLEKGKSHFSQVHQLMTIQFPFPYVQAARVLLIMYGLLTPFVMVYWGKNIWHSFLFTFMSTMGMYAIEITASEIENPFGENTNDLPAFEFQVELNELLLLLMDPMTHTVPALTAKADLSLRHLVTNAKVLSDVVSEAVALEQDQRSLDYMTRVDNADFSREGTVADEITKSELLLKSHQSVQQARLLRRAPSELHRYHVNEWLLQRQVVLLEKLVNDRPETADLSDDLPIQAQGHSMDIPDSVPIKPWLHDSYRVRQHQLRHSATHG